MKLFLFILLFPLFAVSQELNLTNTEWELSGVGCIDSSFNYSSFRTKTPSSDKVDFTAGIFKFIGIDRVEMEVTVQGVDKTYRGTYSINGDEIEIRGNPNPTYIQYDNLGNRILIITGSGFDSWDNCDCPYREELEGNEDNVSLSKDEYLDKHREFRRKCKREYPFVYILRQN